MWQMLPGEAVGPTEQELMSSHCTFASGEALITALLYFAAVPFVL